MTPDLVEACRRAVHLVLPEGLLLRAGAAVLEALHLIGWHPGLVRFLRQPLLQPLVELLYRLVASNRALAGRFLFRGEQSSEPA